MKNKMAGASVEQQYNFDLREVQFLRDMMFEF